MTRTDANKPAKPATVAGDLPAGTRLGDLKLNRVLGRGATGVVYEAEDDGGALSAVKVLPASSAAEWESLRRFLREGKSTARLNHPNVVAVHKVGHHAGNYYIVMELLTGGSAQDKLKAGGWYPWLRATKVVAAVCRGLAEVHAQGLIHRDIKPANIMFAGDDTVKLADFGLAKPTVGGAGQTVTAAGAMVGTPQYMSPEQFRGAKPDARADIYSLGATYFALLTGQAPFASAGSEMMKVMYAHTHAPRPDPRTVDPEIPAPCADIVAKAMAREPDERYASADEMAADLESATAPRAAGKPGKPWWKLW